MFYVIVILFNFTQIVFYLSNIMLGKYKTRRFIIPNEINTVFLVSPNYIEISLCNYSLI